jgi:hypothetical protein
MASSHQPVKPPALADVLAEPGPAAGKNGNGNAQTVRWLVGVLATALVGLVGGMLTTVKGNAEHIAAPQQRLESLERQFERIDNKLDRLIERKEHARP